ncbi:unnamed protein product [Symbiodinium natans]|uniref:Uncharacterized protein n=1 Tax=Symbiodinium natans TaxID=878477 RepID=A0A812U5P6_9DINO|nr:unnamed protein product [Symbiodinium natans]
MAEELLSQCAELAGGKPDFAAARDEADEACDAEVKAEPGHEKEEVANLVAALTPMQRAAVSNAANRHISLVRGPPGTGKTHVAAAMALSVSSTFTQDQRVLAVTQSHAAAINLHRRLEHFDVPAARVGWTLSAQEVVSQKIFEVMRASRGEEDEESNLLIRMSCSGKPEEKDGLRSKEQQRAHFVVMRRMARLSQVIVMTFASSGNAVLLQGLGEIPLLLVDEAAQCVEPGLFVPLNWGSQAFALVGDEKQLPATIKSTKAVQLELGVSIFERFVRDGIVSQGSGFVQLDEQQRMHPSISRFPCDAFYGGTVRDGAEMSQREPIPGFPWPVPECHVAFVECGVYSGEEGALGGSHSNYREAEVLLAVLKRCLLEGTAASQIGIITGYSAQQALLQREVAKLGLPGLRVDTVDGFQAMIRPDQLDVVVLGATGFTGKLACEYLASYGDKVSWAMAGRDLAKLEATRAGLPTKADIKLLKVNLKKDELVELAKKTKVIMNFAGSPYSDKALPVVEACASTGCCYIDITAEVPFIKTSAERYDAVAKQSKALILHSCGFDSVPSDLGALMAAREMRKRHDADCSAIRSFVYASGGFSGGTLHSLMHMYQAKDVENYDALIRPYGLDPPGGQAGPDTCDGGSIDQLPGYEPLVDQWIMPWVMAPINVRNVRRSNALSGYSYGQTCSVGEEGYFQVKTIALADKEASKAPLKVVAHVQSGKCGDPGYKSTALMSVECALCCVLTPSFALGQVLIDRLNRAGMKLFVRSHFKVGFMRDPRRVNVLLTRARRGLVVFGNGPTLSSEVETWRPWLAWVRDQGAHMLAEHLFDGAGLGGHIPCVDPWDLPEVSGPSDVDRSMSSTPSPERPPTASYRPASFPPFPGAVPPAAFPPPTSFPEPASFPRPASFPPPASAPRPASFPPPASVPRPVSFPPFPPASFPPAPIPASAPTTAATTAPASVPEPANAPATATIPATSLLPPLCPWTAARTHAHGAHTKQDLHQAQTRASAWLGDEAKQRTDVAIEELAASVDTNFRKRQEQRVKDAEISDSNVWVEYVDPVTQKIWLQNEETGETMWKHDMIKGNQARR